MMITGAGMPRRPIHCESGLCRTRINQSINLKSLRAEWRQIDLGILTSQ